MVNGRKLRNALAAGIGGAAMLALPWAFVSCSDDGGTESTEVRSDAGAPALSARTAPVPENDDTTDAVTAGPATQEAAAPEPREVVSYEDAESAFREKRYSRAVELFTRYTERRSMNPWGYYMLGLSAWKAGDGAAAEAAFHRAVELDGDHIKSRLNLSRVLLDTGRPDEALAQIDTALAVDAESGAACRLQGRALRQLGHKNDAVRAYRRALGFDDRDVWSMNNLGLILIEEGRFDEALPPLARAVELSGDVAVFFNNLGMALEGTGHFRAAEEAYASAVTIDTLYDKAATNLERITAVVEDPGLDPVDLGILARRFVDELEGDPRVAGASAESTAPAIIPVVASKPDSAGSDRE